MLGRALDHLEEWLIATLIAAATMLIFFAVVHRYGTGASIDLSKWATAHGLTLLARSCSAIFRWLSSIDVSWAQELCIYMFIWMAKFGAAYGVRTGIHVGVDVFVNMLGPTSRKRVIVFGLLCGALVHRDSRCLWRRLCLEGLPYRHPLERSRSENVDRLFGDPARLRADVLPLPAGCLVVLLDRRTAAS